MKIECAPGNHDVTFAYKDGSTVYAEETITVEVKSGLETKVIGFIDGSGSSGSSESQTTVMQPIEGGVKTTEPVIVEASVAPATTSTPGTKITFEAGSFTKDSTDAVLNLSVTSAGGEFSVTSTGPSAPVAGINISLLVNGNEVKEFNGKEVVIETYIAKNLTDVVVKYNGQNGGQPIASSSGTNVADRLVSDEGETLGYNPNTGLLRFKTNHFSEYYVLSDAAAINTTSNTAFATLAEAVLGASEGDTILMLKDFANTNYSNAANLALNKNAVLDGNGHTIEGNVSVYVNADGGTVRNIVFKNIHNNKLDAGASSWGISGKTGDKSAIYGSDLKGKMVVENCVFDTVDWEGIQITPKTDSADIQITGNTFRFTKNEENGIKDPLRYIHIQSNSGVAFKAVIKNNYLFDCSVLYQTGLELYYPSDLSKIDISDNYIDNPVAVCIIDSNRKECPQLALPFSVGPNGESAFDAVCWTYDKWGNQIFYSDLSDACVVGYKTIIMLKDSIGKGIGSADGSKTRESLTIDFNGHTYTMKDPAVGSTGTETQAMHWGKSLGSVTMKNGTFNIIENPQYVYMAMQNYINFTAENMRFDFSNIPVEHYLDDEFSGKWAIFNGKECSIFNNNSADCMKLTGCKVIMPQDSEVGIYAGEKGLLLENCIITGSVNMQHLDAETYVKTKNTTISKGVVSYFDTNEYKIDFTTDEEGYDVYKFVGITTEE